MQDHTIRTTKWKSGMFIYEIYVYIYIHKYKNIKIYLDIKTLYSLTTDENQKRWFAG